jgi:hypothetical protein
MGGHSFLSLFCFAAAGAWPTLFNAIETAIMSPIERAARHSICGTPFHAAPEFLGHCAVCWVGSAILVAAGVIVLMANRDRSAPVRVR